VVNVWVADLVAAIGFVVLSRLLGPRLMGRAGLAWLIVEFSTVVVRQGLHPALVQRLKLGSRQLDTAFWMCAVAGALGAAFWAAAAGVAARSLGQPELEPVLRWSSLALIPASLGTVHAALLQRRFGFRSLAIQRLVSVALGAAVGISMAMRGWGIHAAVAMYLVIAFVSCVTLWIACDWRPHARPAWSDARELSVFGLPAAGKDAVAFAHGRADEFLVGAFLGPAALAYYGVGLRFVAMLSGLFGRSVASVALVMFSEVQDDRERLGRALATTTQTIAVFAIPAFFGMAALAPQIVAAVFGPTWETSAPPLRILSILGIAVSLGQFHRQLIVAAGRPGWAFALASLRAAAVVAGTVAVLTLGSGLQGVAAVSVAGAYAVEPIALAMLKRLCGITLTTYLRGFLAPVAAAAVMTAAVLVARELLPDGCPPVWSLVVLVPLGMAFYAGTLMILAPRLIQRTLDHLWSIVIPPADPAEPARQRQD
jgi:PST family polysaccharide transporter